MADARYVIDIIINAKDNTAAAYASAVGNAEAFKRLTAEQKRENDNLARSFTDMTERLSTSQKTLKEQLDSVAMGSKEAARQMVDLQNATKDYVKQVDEHGRKSAQAVLALDKLQDSQKKLTATLKEQGDEQAHLTGINIVESTKRIAQIQKEQKATVEAARIKAQTDKESAAVRAQLLQQEQQQADEAERKRQASFAARQAQLAREAQAEQDMARVRQSLREAEDRQAAEAEQRRQANFQTRLDQLNRQAQAEREMAEVRLALGRQETEQARQQEAERTANFEARQAQLERQAQAEREMAEVRIRLGQQEAEQAAQEEAARQANFEARQAQLEREARAAQELAAVRRALGAAEQQQADEEEAARIANFEARRAQEAEAQRNFLENARARLTAIQNTNRDEIAGRERELNLGREYIDQIQQIANLERQRDDARKRGAVVEVAKLDIDVADARRKAEATAVELRALLAHIEANVDLDDADAVAHAVALREILGAILKDLEIKVDVDAGRAIAELVAVRKASEDVKSEMGLMRGLLRSVSEGFEGSSGRIAAFDNFLRGLMSLGIATFFNQLILLAGAAAGAFLALASSAAMAGAAIGGALTAGLAQAIPVVGILGAAISRVSAVFKAAQQAQLLQQQQSYQGTQQDQRTAAAADQVRSAQERLADAHRRVADAQKRLNDSREEAANKLRDLILQERGLSLTMEETQDAIAKAVRQGDVSALPRLQLQRDTTRAQLGDVRGEISERRAAGPSGAPEVQQAAEGLRDAQRAARDAARGLEQAKRSAAEAEAGVTAAAGKLTFLLGQLSEAEQRLYRAIRRLQTVWREFAQEATEPLINAFTDAVKKITALLQDKTIINAAKGLASELAEQFTRIFDEFTSNQAIAQLGRIVEQAKDNLKPLTDIAINIGHAFLDVGEAAGPALTEILEWVRDITKDIATFFSEGRKSGDLQKFFTDGVTHLKAWGDLLWEVIRLFAAIAGPGGGADTGLKMVQDLGKAIRGWADDIREPGSKLNTFFTNFFDLSRKMLDAMAPVLTAIADEFDKTFTKDGLKSVEGFATFLADVLIPALGDFARTMGYITGKIGEFAEAHPQLTKFASAMLGATLVLGILNKAISAFGFVLGPIKFLIERFGILEKIGGRLGPIFTKIKPPLAIGGPFVLVTAAIVGLLAISGKLDDVWRKVVDTGKRIWEGIQPGLKEVKTSFVELVDVIQKGGGLISVLKIIGSVLAEVIMVVIDVFGGTFIRIFNGVADAVSGVFDIIKGILKVFTGDFSGFGDILGGLGKIAEGMLKIWTALPAEFLKLAIELGEAILDGIGQGLEALAEAFISFFSDAWKSVLKWFGVHSPSTVAADLGKSIIDGLWEGLKAAGRLLRNAARWIWDQIENQIKRQIAGWTAIGRWVYNAIMDGLRTVRRLLHDAGEWVWNRIKEAIQREIRGATNIGRWIWQAIKNGAEAVAELLSSVGKWVWNKIKDAIRAEVRGWVNIGTWIYNAIKDAIEGAAGIGSKLFDIGKNIIGKLIEGVKSAVGQVGTAAKDLANAFVDLINGILPDRLGPIHLPDIPHVQQGGGIGGYGGGDSVLAMLEPGEHVFTKEEVAAAGGHGVLFALRRMLGGGTQASGLGMANGGAAPGMRGFFGSATGGEIPVKQAEEAEKDRQDFKRSNEKRAEDWRTMWKDMLTTARRYANDIAKQIRDMRVDTTTTLVRMRRDFGKILGDIEDSFKSHSSNIVDSWTTTIDSLKKVTYEGLTYIGHETNKALTALGASAIHFSLTAPVRQEPDRAPAAGHATGGIVGLPGERGPDAVRTVLGRGEAVLNYAQQAYVEPALHAFYGHGLQDTFKRIRGYHAGGPGLGFAGGGFTGPGHSGEGFTPVWNMARNKFHMTGFTGHDGHTQMTSSGNVSDHWYHRALDMSNGVLTAQEDALAAFFKTKVPQVVKQLIWRNKDQFSGFPIGGHEDHVHLAMPDRYAFNQSLMAKILSRAMRGLSIDELLSGAGGVDVDHVDPVRVDGPGPLRLIAQKLLNKARAAANAFIDKEAARLAPGFDTGPGHGEPYDGPLNQTFDNPNTTISFEQAVGLAKQAGFPDSVATLFGHIASAESTLRPGIINSIGATGLWQIYNHPDLVAKYGDMRNPWHNAQAAYDLWKAGGTGPWVSSQGAWGQYAAEGGYAGDAPPEFAVGGQVPGGPGQPVPIIAHAGEWVLNKAQQNKIAAMIGLGTDRLRDMLGFSGGPKHFQGGGEVAVRGPRIGVPHQFQSSGPLDAPELSGILKAIADVRKALADLKRSKAKDKFEKFASQMSKLSSEDGLLSEMAEDIQNMGTRLQRTIDLAKVGFRRVGSKLLRRSPLVDAVVIAQQSVDMYADLYVALRRQRTEAEKGLSETNAKIKEIEKGGVSKKERDTYNKLVAARKAFHDRLDEADQAIAENRANMFQAQLDRFEAQTQAALKPSQRAQMVAGLQQRVGAAFGDDEGVRAAGVAQLGALQSQQAALQQRYAQAAAKAAKDPRWQAVADDLEKQLYDVAGSIAEQTHNNLQLGLEAVNKQFARKSTYNEIARRWYTAFGRSDMLAGVLQQNIDNMKDNVTALQGQLEAARAAGDVGLFNTIADQIAELQTSIVEATAQQFQDAIDAVDKAAANRERQLGLRSRLADLQERAGDRLGAISARQGISGARIDSLRAQRGGLADLLAQATAAGNLDQMQALTEKIEDLDVTIAEEIQTQKDLIFTYRNVATQIITERTGRITGLIGTASSIIQKVGELAGVINFPRLQALLVQTGNTLRQAAIDIADNVAAAIPDFGGEAGGVLGQLRAAFQQGPEAFATTLANLGPLIARLEEGMSPEQKTAFQALIQSMIDNTTATLDNNDQLNQLNNRNTAQGFSSSLWQVFRQAVFTGSGQILPEFQYAFPQMQSGGYIHATGLYNLHAGEMVVPAAQVNGGGQGTFQQNLYITNPTEVADPDYIFAVAEFHRSNRRAT